jgi:mono/diheme cytochrome c family protein
MDNLEVPMKKIFKWIGIVVGSLLGLFVIALLVLFLMGNSSINRSYDLPVDPLTLPTDAESLARGKYLVNILCTGCHGPDLSGEVGWFNGGPLGTIDSANLTSGEGGFGREAASVDDWVRAIRYGVDPEGKPIYMPSVAAFNHLGDADLAAIIAYVKSVPAVDHETTGHQFGILGVILFGGKQFTMPVETVDHASAAPQAPAAGVTKEYGEYLVNITDCRLCHGQQLAGGHHPDPTIKVQVPNLTPGGDLGPWTAEGFVTFMRTGVTPDKRQLNPMLMPWKEMGQMSDGELQAIFLYLHSLPSMPTQTK